MPLNRQHESHKQSPPRKFAAIASATLCLFYSIGSPTPAPAEGATQRSFRTEHVAAGAGARGAQAAQGATDARVALLVAEWTRAKTGTMEYIDAMPEDGINFKPAPQVRSFAEQMLHIAGGNYMFAAAAAGRENPYDSSKGKNPEKMENLKASKAELKRFVLGSYDFVIDAVKSMSAEQLAGDVEFFKMKMSRGLLLAKAIEHHAHHRGQTTIYLRLKGQTPPSERLF